MAGFPKVNLNEKAKELTMAEAGVIEINIAQTKDLMNDFAQMNTLGEWIAIWYKYNQDE